MKTKERISGVMFSTPSYIIDKVCDELKEFRHEMLAKARESDSEEELDELSVEVMRQVYRDNAPQCESKEEIIKMMAMYVIRINPKKALDISVKLADRRIARFDEELVAIELFREGMAIKEVVKQLGISATKAGEYAALAKSEGVTITKKYAGKIEGKSKYFSLKMSSEIDKLIMSGYCNREIAFLLNIHPSSKVGCRRGELVRLGMNVPAPNPISDENYEYVMLYVQEELEAKVLKKNPAKDSSAEDVSGWDEKYEEQRAYANSLLNSGVSIPVVFRSLCIKFGGSPDPNEASEHIYFPTIASIECLVYGSESELSRNKAQYHFEVDKYGNRCIVYRNTLDSINYDEHRHVIDDTIVSMLRNGDSFKRFFHEWELCKFNRYIISNVLEDYGTNNLYRRYISLSDELVNELNAFIASKG